MRDPRGPTTIYTVSFRRPQNPVARLNNIEVAERPKPWSGTEWAVALRFDNPRATVLVLVLG